MGQVMANSLWILQVVGVAAGHILAMKLMWPQSNALSQGKLTAASRYQQKEAKGYFVLADKHRMSCTWCRPHFVCPG